MRQITSALPRPGWVRHLQRKLIRARASEGYRLIDPSEVTPGMTTGWKSETIPAQQRRIVDAELAQMRTGYAPKQFVVAAEAVRQTGNLNATILEIGCASGYYGEVLDYLLDCKLRYAGLDYSTPLVELAHQLYPRTPFLNGDATRLPFANASWDVVISGCVILHIPDWQAAAIETTRVAKEWCIFHRTPICRGPTQLTSKRAYGVEVLEWRFNESDLMAVVGAYKYELAAALPISTGDKAAGVGGELSSITYLFHKIA